MRMKPLPVVKPLPCTSLLRTEGIEDPFSLRRALGTDRESVVDLRQSPSRPYGQNRGFAFRLGTPGLAEAHFPSLEVALAALQGWLRDVGLPEGGKLIALDVIVRAYESSREERIYPLRPPRRVEELADALELPLTYYIEPEASMGFWWSGFLAGGLL